jgi:hypothetical protein
MSEIAQKIILYNGTSTKLFCYRSNRFYPFKNNFEFN